MIAQIHQIVFSPAGHTKQITQAVAGVFSSDFNSVDLMQRDADYSALRFGADDVCLFGVPVFGGRIPFVAAERIGQSTGNGARAVAMVSYGNRAYEDALLELKNLLEERGFVVVGAVAAVAEHSICGQFATGRPNKDDFTEINNFAHQLKTQIFASNEAENIDVPGDFPYRWFGGVPLKPNTSNKCIKCGACSRKCPVDAISPKSPRETNKAKCITCMHCISVCPVQARSLSWVMRFFAGQKLKKVCAKPLPNEFFLPQ